MNKKIVAIHQPNFFPWLGFFDKIIKSDVFLMMDTAQIPQKKPSWTNRVKIIVEKKECYCPTLDLVRNHHGVIPIKEALIVEDSICKKKIVRTIYFNYRKSAFFNQVYPFIETHILSKENSIADYNLSSIKALLEKLDIDKNKIIKTSEIGFEMSKEDLSVLITKMVKNVSGTTYLSGNCSMGYLDHQAFANAGIELIFQNYIHPVYKQFSTSTFIPGLSIIDALMNLGFEGVKEIIHDKH
jgi:hypothetical protein